MIKIIDSYLFRVVKVNLVQKVRTPIIILLEAMVVQINNVPLAK